MYSKIVYLLGFTRTANSDRSRSHLFRRENVLVETSALLHDPTLGMPQCHVLGTLSGGAHQ